MNCRGKVLLGIALAMATAWCGQTLIAQEDAAAGQTEKGMPLLFQDGFEAGCDRWVLTDSAAWKVLDEEGQPVLSLFGKSNYAPPFRSPLCIARVKDLEVSDFVMETRMKQTGKEYNHRDLCLIFGYQDPAHYYYAHIATRADANANSIFIVNGAPRTSIAKERTQGTDWGAGYHRVRIERSTDTGEIKVFFDDMEKPIMRAEDKTFLWGEVGVGSFDDTGNIDDVKVWGKKAEKSHS